MAILAFIGCDKTGKSTLFKEVLKRTNEHICIDRFAPCQVVYGKYHGKGHPSINKLREMEEYLAQGPIKFIYVYVTADTQIIVDRFIKHGETDIAIEHIKNIKNEYIQFLKESMVSKIRIDTTRYTIKQCADFILEYASSLEEQYGS